MLKGATVLNILVYWKSFNRLPAGNYMFKVNNRNTRISYEICSKLTIKWIYLIYVYNWICEESFISEHSCSNLLHKFASTDVISASLHCVKNVQIRSFFWSVFSHIRTEYGDLLCKPMYSVRMRKNKDQKKLRIYTLFTQWKKMRKIRVFFVKFEYLARIFKSFSSEVMKHKAFFNISALQI